jgi:molecular chaperone GrpE
MTKKKSESSQIKEDTPINFELMIENLNKEIEGLNDSLLRERADAANVRRRADEDRIKLAGYYKAHVIKELLPVIDNFERALKAVPKDLEKNEFIAGIEKIVNQFEQALAKIGVERIKTVGEHFNPEVHEAVTMDEGDGKEEIVSEELQSGYIIGDEVIRHAMVRVKS